MIRDIRGIPLSNYEALDEVSVLLGRLQEQYEDDIVAQQKLREARKQVEAVRQHEQSND